MITAMSSGMSRARLARMHDVMAGHVEAGHVPGFVTLISRHGQVHVETMGTTAVQGDDPMRPDTLFRITSMTKPVTAVAAVILVEECRLRLDEPVDRLLPELADRRVLTRPDAPLDDTVPADRPITVRDLLTFRSGYGALFGPDASAPYQKAADELELRLGPPTPRTPHDPDEWLRRLATLPLLHQPGASWLYNTGSQILGVLIERASGQSFEAFLRERIFEPLCMTGTGFTVPEEDRPRLAPAYDVDPGTGALVQSDGVEDSVWNQPPALPDGAAGLISTIEDYHAFALMMLEHGRYGSERVLSRPAVETMITDQLTPAQKASSGFFPGWWDGLGWGFGVAVVTKRDAISAVPGRYGWDGGAGTTWWNDPTEDLIAILMTQRAEFPRLSDVYNDFWTSVYQAIDD